MNNNRMTRCMKDLSLPASPVGKGIGADNGEVVEAARKAMKAFGVLADCPPIMRIIDKVDRIVLNGAELPSRPVNVNRKVGRM